jgi:hypothetical protein
LKNPRLIGVAGGSTLEAVGEGDINSGSGIIFKNVLFVPKSGYNLLSVPSNVQKNMSVNFDKSGCKIQQSGQTIFKGAKFGDLYVINPNKIPSALYLASKVKN